jgi:hypothetical protein
MIPNFRFKGLGYIPLRCLYHDLFQPFLFSRPSYFENKCNELRTFIHSVLGLSMRTHQITRRVRIRVANPSKWTVYLMSTALGKSRNSKYRATEKNSIDKNFESVHNDDVLRIWMDPARTSVGTDSLISFNSHLKQGPEVSLESDPCSCSEPEG